MTALKKAKYEVEEEYDEVVEYNCPKRGKVKQIIKVKRYKSQSSPEPVTR